MTIKGAQNQLALYRGQQRELRKAIDRLRAFLRSKGINPDPPAVDLTARNKTMYNRYLDGLSWEEIAKEFRLSKKRVKMICRRVEIQNEKRAKREADEAL